jgi:hypothetical protein
MNDNNQVNKNKIREATKKHLDYCLSHINSKSSLLTNCLLILSAGGFSLLIYNIKYFAETNINLGWSSLFKWWAEL